MDIGTLPSPVIAKEDSELVKTVKEIVEGMKGLQKRMSYIEKSVEDIVQNPPNSSRLLSATNSSKLKETSAQIWETSLQ